MLYDYGWYDDDEDSIIRDALQNPTVPRIVVNVPFDILITGSGSFGYANAHRETLIQAKKYLDGIYGNTDNPANQMPLNDRIGMAGYLLSDQGTISAAALASRYYADMYCFTPSGHQVHDPTNLTPEDMALIWGAYRAGIKDVPPAGGGYDSRSIYQTWLSSHPTNQSDSIVVNGYPPPNAVTLGSNGTLALPLMELMKQKNWFGNGK